MNAKNDNKGLLSELDRIKKTILRYDDPAMIPKIERDILLSAIRDLYETIITIPDTSQVIQEPEKIISHEKQSLEGKKEQDEEQDEMIEFIDEKQSGGETETETKPQADHIHEKDTEKNKKDDEKKKEKIKTLAEKFQGNSHYVYENLSDKSQQQNVSGKLQSRPIADIAASIGVNDKFKLIRDLFNGDAESFRKTIEILNNSTNFNEAFNYISTNFNWDMEDGSVQFILDLVRRKFIVDKNE